MNFFTIFFQNFLSRVVYERNSGLKFFSPFLSLCHPVLAKNIAGKRFFRFFWIFLQFFSEFSFRGPVQEEFRHKICFLPFSAYLIPFWLEVLPEIGFLIFWIFSLFFSEFFCRGREWTELGPKIFFSLTRPISSRFS